MQRSPVVEGLFDSDLLGDVAAFEYWGSGDPAWLLDAERAETTSMGDNRRAEFAAGRQCARRAIGALAGGPAVHSEPLLSGDDRPPIWPAGFHGSISHTRGWCGAAVAPLQQLDHAGRRRMGIDGELVGRVHERLWRRLFTGPERTWLAGLADPTLACTVMFSLKEAFYKAQYPLTRAWVGFEDVQIEWTDDQPMLHPATDLAALDAVTWPVVGRWSRLPHDALVVTGVLVSASSNTSEMSLAR